MRSRDFRLLWLSQGISTLGSSFTAFALPLLVFKLTGSALSLGIALAVTYLPYPLLGLFAGALVDRLDRRRTMVMCDVARALLLATIPLLAALEALDLVWLYTIMFASSVLTIAANAAEMAALPRLVAAGELIQANTRLQATIAGAAIVGPLLAGVLVTLAPIQTLFTADAVSFVVSAGLLCAIRTPLVPEGAHTGSLRAGALQGLTFVWRNPLLRTISLMTALLSFLGSTIEAQIVFFAAERLDATDGQIAIIFAAAGAGIVLCSVAAPILSRFGSFGAIALGAAIAKGVAMTLLGLTHHFVLALVLWGLSEGLAILFSINTVSLRQAIVPDALQGRVQVVARVMAWSAIPAGTLLGGAVIQATGDVGLVFTAIGLINVAIAIGFVFSPLRLAHPEALRRPAAVGAEA